VHADADLKGEQLMKLDQIILNLAALNGSEPAPKKKAPAKKQPAVVAPAVTAKDRIVEAFSAHDELLEVTAARIVAAFHLDQKGITAAALVAGVHEHEKPYTGVVQ
jgi:hypothetical protein